MNYEKAGSGAYLIVGGNAQSRLEKAKKVAPETVTVSVSKVEEIRSLEKLIHTGQSVILEDAQNLTTEAQNAFLKTLEEPPENVSIILLAQNEDQLLETVVSRCFLVNLSPSNPSNPPNPPNFEALKTTTDRATALTLIDDLLAAKPYHLTRPLFEAKKYLKANCNVKLTLENLFLNC
jgi:DNA polymerase III delta prime subunit